MCLEFQFATSYITPLHFEVSKMTIPKPEWLTLLPVEQGHQLLPTAIDEIARTDPNRIFGEFIDSPITPGGIHKLDFNNLARAIDRTAEWMKSTLDELQLARFSIIAYAGYPDVRYYFILVAAIKCGYIVISTPNPRDKGVPADMNTPTGLLPIHHKRRKELSPFIERHKFFCFPLYLPGCFRRDTFSKGGVQITLFFGARTGGFDYRKSKESVSIHEDIC